MKNFKLLLGATALLSATAISANAELSGLEDSLTTFEVKAEIVKNLNVVQAAPLDFGTIAWAFTEGLEGHLISFYPDSSGAPNPHYTNVSFHANEGIGKVCFTDLVPTAELGNGLTVTVDSIPAIKDTSNNTIAEYLGTDNDPDSVADAGEGETAGTRCVYIGGQLHWFDTAAARAFSGEISAYTTVTVLYDSVNSDD